jgi:putative transcriptional regulator
MSKDRVVGSLGSQILAGLSEFCKALDEGEPIGKKFTVRSVSLELEARPYGPGDVKAARERLNLSQPLLARLLGVSVKTLRSWEQGLKPVPRMASNYLNDILANPEILTKKLRMQGSGEADGQTCGS